MLLQRELSGYDIWKELSIKGVKIRTNYLYMILAEMHSRELLKARWLENTKGRRKHLYSLSKKGEDEFRGLLKESLDFIMDAFVHANLAAQDLPDHVDSIRRLFSILGVRPPAAGSKLVITMPSFDPLICYPISFYALSEAFPTSSVFVVKPPGTNLYGDKPNLTFVDGRRHDMPLKDGFADYLMLEGFPTGVSVEDTISECIRVLKNEGHLIIRAPNVMTEEKKPRFAAFPEFTSKLFYDFTGEDRTISVEHLKLLLSTQSARIKEAESHGSVVIYAQVIKKPLLQPYGSLQNLAGEAQFLGPTSSHP